MGFRGSDQIQDWLQNLDFRMTRFLNTEHFPHLSRLKVHNGIFENVHDFEDKTDRIVFRNGPLKGNLAQIMRDGPGRKQCFFWLIGHSLGGAMATLFASEGAKVVAVDYAGDTAEETAKQVRASGGEATAVKADVSKAEDVDRMVRTAVEKYGGVDILCNNAGILGPYTKPQETDDSVWDMVIGINLKGVFLGSRRAIPEMLKRGKGAIVNTASIAGLIGGAGPFVYTVSKHGVVGLTRAMAVGLAPQIRVNAICPGAVETGMTRGLLKDPATLQFLESVPLRVIGQPIDIAQAALYLASDDSKFVTGALLVVDGGWTVK